MNDKDTFEYLFIHTIEHLENVGLAALAIDKVFNDFNLNQDSRHGEMISDYDLEQYSIQLLAALTGDVHQHTEWIEWYLYEVKGPFSSDGYVTWFDEDGNERELYITTPKKLYDFLTKDFDSYINDTTGGRW